MEPDAVERWAGPGRIEGADERRARHDPGLAAAGQPADDHRPRPVDLADGRGARVQHRGVAAHLHGPAPAERRILLVPYLVDDVVALVAAGDVPAKARELTEVVGRDVQAARIVGPCRGAV